jgi:hypothetical protein
MNRHLDYFELNIEKRFFNIILISSFFISLLLQTACSPTKYEFQNVKVETPQVLNETPAAVAPPVVIPPPPEVVPVIEPPPVVVAPPPPPVAPPPVVTPPPPVVTPKTSESFKLKDFYRKLDVLFVVDNSISMADDQAKLGQRIQSFLGVVNGLDWQIAVTTTDVSEGPHGLKGGFLSFDKSGNKILKPSTPDYAKNFFSTVVRKESVNCSSPKPTEFCASNEEQPLKAIIMSTQKSQNKSFFRDQAHLVTIVLSDEDEMSDAPSKATRAEEVVRSVKDNFGSEKKYSNYGIVIRPGDSECLRKNSMGEYATRVADLTSLTGGHLGSLCDDDFGPALSKIAKSVIEKTQSLELAYEPKEGSLEVSFIPSSQAIKYEVSGKKILLLSPPEDGVEIVVKYHKK